MKIGLLGCGTVGSGVVEIIEKLKCRYGFNIERKLYESKKL